MLLCEECEAFVFPYGLEHSRIDLETVESMNVSGSRIVLRYSLPALLVGILFVFLLLYGRYVVPLRVQSSYEARENALLAQYDLDKGSSDDLDRLVDEIDIVNSRLAEMRGGAERYWKWASFWLRHARVVHQRGSAAGNDNESQLASKHADERSLELCSIVANGTSEFVPLAQIEVAELQLLRCLKGIVQPDFDGLEESLQEAIETLSLDTISDSEVNSQRAHQVLLLMRLEHAWQVTSGQRLYFDPACLEAAAAQASETHSTRANGARQVLQAFGFLTSYDQEAVSDASGDSWDDSYLDLLSAAASGDWSDVAFQLSRERSGNPEAVRYGVGRWICRLAVSKKAEDSEWREKYSSGVQLVSQIAPQLPELSELIWLIAEQHQSRADAVREAVGQRLEPELVQAVIEGRAVAVRHVVLALSSTIAGKQKVARSHMQLTKRLSGSLALLSHVALGKLNTTTVGPGDLATISELMEVACDLEPASGLNWFVLGVARQRQGDVSAAAEALEKANSLLPSVPAIESMLESVRSEVRRKSREAQLRPVE